MPDRRHRSPRKGSDFSARSRQDRPGSKALVVLSLALLFPARALGGNETTLASPYLEKRLAAERSLRSDADVGPSEWRDLLNGASAHRLRRFHLLAAAAEQASREVLAGLLPFAGDPDPAVRGAAAEATIRIARTIGEDVRGALRAFDADEAGAAIRRVVLADLVALQTGVKPAGIHNDRAYRDLMGLASAAVEPLLEVAREKAFRPDTRAAAIVALSRVSEPGTAGPVAAFIDETARSVPEEVRIAAAAALGHLGRLEPAAERALADATHDFSPSVRNYANWGLVTLTDLSDEAARERLSGILAPQILAEQTEGVLSILAFGAIALRDPALLPGLLEAHGRAYGYAPFYLLEAIAAYLPHEADAVAAVERACSSRIPAERVLAEVSLGRTPSEETLRALEAQVLKGHPQIDDDSSLAVKTALRAFGLAGGPIALRVLREKAKDTDDGIRTEALLALGVGGFEEAGDLLEDAAASDDYEYARLFSCTALRLLHDTRFVPFAIDLLDCGNFYVHREAARLLLETTGETCGYDARSGRAERLRSRAALERWWGERFERLRFDQKTGRIAEG